MFYYVLYLLIHSVIDLCVCLAKAIRLIQIYAIHILHFVININVWRPQHRTANAGLQSYHFRKQPLHVGIVINEKSLSLSDISDLILWCLCLHIHHISIYDIKGCVKKNGALLYEQVSKKKLEYLKESHKYKIIFKNIEDLPDYKGTNGVSSEKFFVHLLAREDGHSKIAAAARHVCLDVKTDYSLLEKFSCNQFNEYMKDAIDIPEPDLIFLFGHTQSLIGYLPWHIHFTEILSLPTHHSLQLSDFLSVLERYEQCEQRFGK